MTTKVPVHKDAVATDYTLWWQPFFRLQQEMNHACMQMMTSVMPNSSTAPLLGDTEEGMLETMQNNTHRVYSELFNNRQLFTPWLTGQMTEPYINITETARHIKVVADVPGLHADDLDVSVGYDALVISGECADESNCANATTLRHERHQGQFSRTIALPEEVDMTKAKAHLNNHILTVTIPKKSKEAMHQHRLKIESGAEPKKPSARRKKTAKRPQLVRNQVDFDKAV
jgi:HSP20 family protein